MFDRTLRRALTLALPLLISLPVLASGMNPKAPPETKQLEFFIGDWDIETSSIQRDGSFVKGHARSHVSWAFDGFALQDDWNQLDAEGNVIFRGTSIRSFDPVKKKWTITWVMVNVSGYTGITAEMNEKGEFVMNGRGHDPLGDFLERARYYDIKDDHYSFDLARSYDGGKTWIEKFGHIEATRVKRAAK